MDREELSNRALARAIGIDQASLSRSLKHDGNPESRTIEKILGYLGYDVKFIKRKGVKLIKSKPSRSRRNSRKEVVSNGRFSGVSGLSQQAKSKE